MGIGSGSGGGSSDDDYNDSINIFSIVKEKRIKCLFATGYMPIYVGI